MDKSMQQCNSFSQSEMEAYQSHLGVGIHHWMTPQNYDVFPIEISLTWKLKLQCLAQITTVDQHPTEVGHIFQNYRIFI